MEELSLSIAHLVAPTEGDVYCQPIIVQTTAIFRIADIDRFGSSSHHIPHLLLYRHGASGIIDLQTQFGMRFLQSNLGFLQRCCCFGKEISSMQITIHHTSYEVVGTSIHETDVYVGNHLCDVHQSLLFHPLFGHRLRLSTCSRLNRGSSQSKERNEEGTMSEQHERNDGIIGRRNRARTRDQVLASVVRICNLHKITIF